MLIRKRQTLTGTTLRVSPILSQGVMVLFLFLSPQERNIPERSGESVREREAWPDMPTTQEIRPTTPPPPKNRTRIGPSWCR